MFWKIFSRKYFLEAKDENVFVFSCLCWDGLQEVFAKHKTNSPLHSNSCNHFHMTIRLSHSKPSSKIDIRSRIVNNSQYQW